MGLLDLTPEQSDSLIDFGTGLLSAGGPSRMPVSLGQAFGQGMGAMRQGDHLRTQNKMQSGQLQMQQLQMDEIKRQLAMKEAMGRALQSGFLSGSAPAVAPGGDQAAPALGLTPPSDGYSPALGAAPAQSSMADQLMLAARKAGDYGAYQDAVKMKMEEKKLEPKFSTDFRVGRGADGKPANFVLGDNGSWKQLPMGVVEKLHFASTGGSTVGLDPYSGVQVSTMRNSQSPDSIASNAIQIRGQNMTDARAMQTLSKGNAPSGYRTTDDGNLMAIPGGPADAKTQALAQQKLVGVTDVDLAIGTLRDAYDRLEKGGGITSTKNSAFSNMAASAGSSAAGQFVGKAFGTNNQSARNDIAMTRPALLGALMKATGMSAKQMDSNAELKLWMATATDPALDVESNRRALDKIEKKYLGGSSSPSTESAISPGGWSATIVK